MLFDGPAGAPGKLDRRYFGHPARSKFSTTLGTQPVQKFQPPAAVSSGHFASVDFRPLRAYLGSHYPMLALILASKLAYQCDDATLRPTLIGATRMTYNRIAQNTFAVLLVLAIVTTIVVQARSAPGLPEPEALVGPATLSETLRFKVSLAVHAIPAPQEEAKKTNCKPWINGFVPPECSRFAGLYAEPSSVETKGYRVELKLHNIASLAERANRP